MPNYGMIDGDWKLVVMERTDGQDMVGLLFNLEEDAVETTNLAAIHSDRRASRSARQRV
ncbi:MAG: hypothetical protein KGS44_12010 [Alphaproteobacteria bacterium]|nr:hypothetical protein [Alphaproteobacteria bacterium]